jgi:hypothetical protein|tara:strand:+ start:2004 stop:2375 length:372 start_codon:yes stop_codon:yes gene_type:complete
MKRVSLNKVMAKLAVEQTPEEKLELASYDVVGGVYAQISLTKNRVNGALIDVKGVAQKYQSVIKKSGMEAIKAKGDLDRMAKEIGVNPNDIPKYGELKKGIDEVSSVVKDIDSLMSKLNSLYI